MLVAGSELYVNGTADNPVVFTAQNNASRTEMGSWVGIIIAGDAGDMVDIDYAHISGANNGIADYRSGTD